jgi:hypothetical protein
MKNVLEIYDGDNLLSTVKLIDGEIQVIAAPGRNQRDQEDFIQTLRRRNMTDKDLFEWLPKRLRSYVYAVEPED